MGLDGTPSKINQSDPIEHHATNARTLHGAKDLGTNRHIVRTLGRMSVHLSVLGNEPIQGITHVDLNILVPILVDGQCARGMLNEEVEEADLVISDLGKLLLDLFRDEVAAPTSTG